MNKLDKVFNFVGATVCFTAIAYGGIIGIQYVGEGLIDYTKRNAELARFTEEQKRLEPRVYGTTKYTMFSIPEKCLIAVDKTTNEIVVIGPCDLSEGTKSFIRSTKPKS